MAFTGVAESWLVCHVQCSQVNRNIMHNFAYCTGSPSGTSALLPWVLSYLPPQDPVVARLKDVVDDFKELLPLVQELGNPALQARHWQDIFDIIGASIPPNEQGVGAHQLMLQPARFSRPPAALINGMGVCRGFVMIMRQAEPRFVLCTSLS